MLARLGRWSFLNPWRMILLWIAGIVSVFVLVGVIGADFNDSFEIEGSESQQGFDTLDEFFAGEGSGPQGSIVFQADAGVDDPAVVAVMEEMFASVAALEGASVSSPYDGPRGVGQIASEGPQAGLVAYATVGIARELSQDDAGQLGEEIRLLVPDVDGLRVEVGGQVLAGFEPPQTELIGLAFAVIILIVAFGSVLAMGLPIGVAVAGVSTGLALMALISNLLTVPSFASSIGAMIGLGVGIDYALFIVTRYRENLVAGHEPVEAIARAMNTAGRAVVFAGLTVVVSLLGMVIIGLAFIVGLGISAAVTVLITMLASISLLPALIGLAKHRVEVTRYRGLISAGLVAVALFGLGVSLPAVALVTLGLALVVLLAGFAVAPLKREVPRKPATPLRETFAYKWSRFVQHRPWSIALVSTALLLAVSAPLLGLRLGFSDEGNFAEETTTRQAYDLLAEAFGPGFNGPVFIVSRLGNPGDVALMDQLSAALAADPGVASVSPPFPNDPSSPGATLIQVIPTTSPQDKATTELVKRLRSDVIPPVVAGTSLEVSVSGFIASGIDLTDFLASRTPVFFAVVLGLSFLLLMAVFRSLLVPLKAVIMNLLSISAGYGLVIMVFQWGWFSGITGIEPAPIEPFVPMMLFAIVFGLSMDYEVFLLSRVKEEFDRTGDAVNSVADGLAMTARVITVAAAIMVVVFGSFVLEDDRVVKLFGLGLASAVFIDATFVRMLLVPATMELLGERNWWMPAWLDRIVPHITVEVIDDSDSDEPGEPERELIGSSS